MMGAEGGSRELVSMETSRDGEVGGWETAATGGSGCDTLDALAMGALLAPVSLANRRRRI